MGIWTRLKAFARPRLVASRRAGARPPPQEVPMAAFDKETLPAEIDALSRALAEERYRHVAGLEPDPALQPIFAAHSRAAHRYTAAALRTEGEEGLASKVAALRTERAQAEDEESWRAALRLGAARRRHRA